MSRDIGERQARRRGKRVYLADEDRIRLERVRRRYSLGVSECIRFLLVAAEEGLPGNADGRSQPAGVPPDEILRALRSQAEGLARCERLLADLHRRRDGSGPVPKASPVFPDPPGGSADAAVAEEIDRLGELAFRDLAAQMLSGEMLGKFGRTGGEPEKS